MKTLFKRYDVHEIGICGQMSQIRNEFRTQQQKHIKVRTPDQYLM